MHLLLAALVDIVGRQPDRQLSAATIAREIFGERMSPPITSNDHIERLPVQVRHKLLLVDIVRLKVRMCPVAETVPMATTITRGLITVILLRLGQADAQLGEGDARHKAHAVDECNLEQDHLQLSDRNVIDRADAKFTIEAFRLETDHVVDHVRPEVNHIVSRELVTFLHTDD